MSSDPQLGYDTFGKGEISDMVDTEQIVDDIGLTQSEIEDRKAFVSFDDSDVEQLEKLEEVITDNLNVIVSDFSDNLLAYEDTQEKVKESPRDTDMLLQSVRAYLVTLTEGEYGEQHFASRAGIGKLHEKFDIPMNRYIGQFSVVYDSIAELIIDRHKRSLSDGLDSTSLDDDDKEAIESMIHEEIDEMYHLMLAMNRILNLDMQVITDTYLDSYAKKLKKEIEKQDMVFQEINDVARGAKKATRKIADQTSQVNELSREQNESMQSLSSEVNSLSSSVEEVAATAEEVAATSENAKQYAEEGEKAASEATEVIEDISDATEQMSEDIQELTEQISSITEIVDVIDNIAVQTNLLALNASIEAAKVDDSHGDGFGVVADEIKSLAEDSQERVNEIDQIVDSITENADKTQDSLEAVTSKVDDGTQQIDETAETFQNITENVREAANGMQQVSNATDKQAASTEEIAATVDELVDKSDDIAEGIRTVSESNEKQVDRVSKLQDIMSKLESDDVGTEDMTIEDGDSGSMPSMPDKMPDEMPDEMPEGHPPMGELPTESEKSDS